MKLIKRNSEVDLPITANSIYRKELMKEHFVRLVFDWDSDNLLEVGDYIIWEGVKYTLLKPYLPDEIEVGWYRYSVDFQAEEMLWSQKYFVYKDVGRKPETEWNMIADASTWLKTVADAILLETGKSVNYFASNLLDGTQGIEIDNISIFAGLNKIADAFNTEWWCDDKGIHLGRYEEGEVVELVVGGNVNPPRIEQDQEYFTRIIPLGSERNIPQNVDAKFVNYKNRLKLDETKYPNGYIDIEELPIERIVPKTVIFDEIYPRAYLKISEVKSEYDKVEQQYIFSVKLKDYTLDKDDILENQTPILAFTGGLLNGRNFEINVGEWLTLINQDSGGIIVPNEVLAPEVGDSVILWNIKMPDKYIKDAQDELEEEAIRYIAKNKQDLRTYSVSTDATSFNDSLSVGSKVKLINGERELTTRVISIEYYLDTPSKATFTIGNNRIKGFMDKLLEEAEIDKIKEQLSKGAKDGTSVVIKGKVDSTDNLPDNPSKGDSYWVGAYLYTWNGVSWVVQDLQGESGSSPYIKDGYWWIDDENTGIKAKGEDGKDGETPYIGINGNWWIGDKDTGIGSKGESGAITYMAGIYSNTKTYKATSLTRPLVFQPDNDTVPTVGKYYYPKEKGVYTGISPKDNPDVWGEAEQFEMILTNTLVANFAKIGAAVFYGDYMMSQEGVDSQGRPSTNFEQFPDNFTPNFLVNYKTGFVSALEGVFKGHIDAYKGTIGGFEIADGRIGAKVEAGEDEAFGSLALYKDFLRVGGKNGYAMLGDNVIPLTAGGAFTAVGRIVNNKPNKGGFGYDNANYGLFIDVTGGKKNYGIHSNAPILSPANISTKVATWDFNFDTYSIDFSQASVFLMSRTRAGSVEVTMPTESSVASQFGMTSLPVGFGFIFTVIAEGGTNKITLNGLYDRNHNPDNFSFTNGDNATILAHKTRTGFEYQILTYNT